MGAQKEAAHQLNYNDEAVLHLIKATMPLQMYGTLSLPYLDKDDPWRNMTDEEILYKYIDLSNSHLTSKGKEEVMDLIITYKKVFSLRDEIMPRYKSEHRG